MRILLGMALGGLLWSVAGNARCAESEEQQQTPAKKWSDTKDDAARELVELLLRSSEPPTRNRFVRDKAAAALRKWARRELKLSLVNSFNTRT